MPGVGLLPQAFLMYLPRLSLSRALSLFPSQCLVVSSKATTLVEFLSLVVRLDSKNPRVGARPKDD
jgi:hypothetical protein